MALNHWYGPHFVGVPTQSMAPTILAGDRIIVSSIVGQVRRGDLVMFRYPSFPDQSYIKRVVATGGESVQVRGAEVLVNGAPLPEQRIFVKVGGDDETFNEVSREGSGDYTVYYIQDELRDEQQNNVFKYAVKEPYRVPLGNVFVLADNRDKSADSRIEGPVPLSNVIGRPIIVYSVKEGGDTSRVFTILR